MKIIRNFIPLLLSFILLTSLSAQTTETELDVKPSAVTIHLQGAEMIQSANVEVPKGRHRFIFTGLSPKLNPQSIQVTASGGVSILSITSKTNFLKDSQTSQAVKALQDSVKILQENVQDNNDMLSVFKEEEDLLQKNKALSGKDASLPVEELVKAADFYRERFLEIRNTVTKLKRENNELQLRINQVNNQLQEFNAGKHPSSEVYVEVEAGAATSSELRLRYVVNEAGWSPVYDLISSGLTEPIKLKYRALAFNDTGLDWENVTLRLSTADPYQGANQPSLKPWVLTVPKAMKGIAEGKGNQPQPGQRNQLNMIQQSQNLNYQYYVDGIPMDRMPAEAFETIEISELSKDFDIEPPYSIPADRKPYSIEITEYVLDATYKHFAIPKLDKDAFLLAQITGWEKLDLISGPMNVYRNENFIGMAQLSTRTLSDTLELSLGRDGNVIVTRTKLEAFSKKQFLSGNKISSFTYKISVKNNHRLPIAIEVQDQVPISETKEIEVEIKDTSNARRIKESGKLIWELSIPSADVKSVNFGYEVKHPSSMEVQMDRKRNVVSPRFY
jgi:uncharacterized protein (TIGR02231 family)